MPQSDRSDLLQGTLDMLILKTLELAPLHGYAIAQRINRVSQALLQVPQGSLYPALHRLEKAKVYRLTKKGRTRLQAEIAGWHRLSDAIALILQSRLA
jgi:DNA-binding PadR family transcriptional regulator